MVTSIYGSTENFDYTDIQEKSSDDGMIVMLRLFVRGESERVSPVAVNKMVDQVKVDFPDLSDYGVRVILPDVDTPKSEGVSAIFNVQLVQQKK